jgi:hypothetical protein
VDIGAKVEAGQLLAEIEPPEVDQELNQARANFAQVAANADLAVMIRSGGPRVLVVDARNLIRSRHVKLGCDLGDKIKIVFGLDPSQPLVANATGAIRDGAEVKVQSQPTDSKWITGEMLIIAGGLR